ncbi:hypothetical protein H1215_12090, partial [Anoxybacillus sp. LAT_38]|nr:hypothetical protein [Anoxybacillus sp. LAT_38]
SLRDIQRQLIEEGRIPADMLVDEETAAAQEQLVSVTGPKAAGLREMELTVQEMMLQFQHELAQLSSLNQLQSTILQK